MEKAAYDVPVIVLISKSNHLNFIGWDNVLYMDVLICENKKNQYCDVASAGLLVRG